MAGLWDYWAPQPELRQRIPAARNSNASVVSRRKLSFTILTTEPNELIAQLHDRMPVILDRSDTAAWLDSEHHDLGKLKGLLKPYPAEQMSYQPYDRYVSNAGNKESNLIVPAGEEVRLAR